METVDFLRTVVTGDTGYFCLAHSDGEGDWTEEFYSWPDELPDIMERATKLGRDTNIYFSPYLFDSKSSLKEHVIVGRTIAADLDEASILTLNIKPTVLVETSPDRHQGYWTLKNESSLEDHEELSKRLTYSIPRCDRSGWYAGKKLRLPDTMNLKYVTGPKYVRVVDVSGLAYDVQDLEAIPTFTELFGKGTIDEEENIDWIDEALKIEIGPQELLASIRTVLPSRIVAQYNTQSPDRSAALWGLMTNAFRAGLDRTKVFHLAFNTINNKFKDLRYGGVKALAKDVMRAQLAVSIKLPDMRAKILEARRLPGMATERNSYIARTVIEHLQKIGTFVHANDGSCWFIREDTGRPIQLSSRSDSLQTLVEVVFGVNGSEVEYKYISRSLLSHVSEMPPLGQVGYLSYYDNDTGTFLMHTGRKDVIKITKHDIVRVSNGYNGIVFPWTINNNVISPKYQALDEPWDEVLFANCFNNLIGIKPDDARAIIKVWLLTVLLREGIVSRPILALHGQAGSGKSTLFRRIYAMLYGRDRALNSVTREDDFDYAVATEPVVVLDNVDTYARWLPDRLALSAAKSEMIKRKLYTDSEVVILQRQAMLGVTAHNPKYGREDVTDRLLLLTFERLEHFLPETQIIDHIIEMRNALWGEVLQDIQKVLATPVPKEGFPQFRVEDFARFGYWIATALGIGEEFYRGITNIRVDQKTFLLEEDMLLVDAISKVTEKGPTQFKLAGQWYSILELSSGNAQEFNKKYSNAVTLGMKFWTLQDALRSIFNIEWQYDNSRRARRWSFERKQTDG